MSRSDMDAAAFGAQAMAKVMRDEPTTRAEDEVAIRAICAPLFSRPALAVAEAA